MPRRTLAAFDLKAARKMRGLSQVKVAQILCTTQPSVARWEADGNMPEVFRKVWEQHWDLETIKSEKSSNDATKTKGGAVVSTDRSAGKVGSRNRRREGTRKGADNSAQGGVASSQDGSADVPESDQAA